MFNWAETLFPDILTPRGGATQTAANYSYRYYRASGSGTGAYLGVDNNTGRLVFLAEANSKLVDVGLLKDFVASAGAAGY